MIFKNKQSITKIACMQIIAMMLLGVAPQWGMLRSGQSHTKRSIPALDTKEISSKKNNEDPTSDKEAAKNSLTTATDLTTAESSAMHHSTASSSGEPHGGDGGQGSAEVHKNANVAGEPPKDATISPEAKPTETLIVEPTAISENTQRAEQNSQASENVQTDAATTAQSEPAQQEGGNPAPSPAQPAPEAAIQTAELSVEVVQIIKPSVANNRMPIPFKPSGLNATDETTKSSGLPQGTSDAGSKKGFDIAGIKEKTSESSKKPSLIKSSTLTGGLDEKSGLSSSTDTFKVASVTTSGANPNGSSQRARSLNLPVGEGIRAKSSHSRAKSADLGSMRTASKENSVKESTTSVVGSSATSELISSGTTTSTLVAASSNAPTATSVKSSTKKKSQPKAKTIDAETKADESQNPSASSNPNKGPSSKKTSGSGNILEKFSSFKDELNNASSEDEKKSLIENADSAVVDIYNSREELKKVNKLSQLAAKLPSEAQDVVAEKVVAAVTSVPSLLSKAIDAVNRILPFEMSIPQSIKSAMKSFTLNVLKDDSTFINSCWPKDEETGIRKAALLPVRAVRSIFYFPAAFTYKSFINYWCSSIVEDLKI